MKKDGTYCEHQFERADRTDNNGLLRITHYLEKIYTDKNWPNYEHAKAPVLDVSLKDSGKSRADLWQFAASVAMESTIERSNHACRYDMWERQQVPLLEGVNKVFTKINSAFPTKGNVTTMIFPFNRAMILLMVYGNVK